MADAVPSTARAFYDSTIWNFVEKLSLYVSGLILSMILTRWLGPSDYGLYASLMSVAAIAPVIISLGFDRALMVESAKLSVQDGAAGRLSFLVRRLLRSRIGLAVLASVVLWVGAPGLARLLRQPAAAETLHLVALYAAFSCLTQLFRSLLIGLLRVRVAALVRLAAEVLTLLAVLMVLRWGWGIPGVLGVFALVNGAAVAGFAWLTRSYVWGRAERVDLRPIYRIGAVAWSVSLLGLLLGKHVDILLMNVFGVPSAQIGFYNLAVNLFVLGGFLGMGSGPIAQAVFARVSVSRREALAAAWASTVKLLSLVTLPVFVFLAWHVHAVIGVLYTEAYAGAAVYFWVYGALLLTYSLIGSSYFDPLFYAVGKAKYVLGFQVAAGLLNLVLDCLLIPIWGALGACLATGSAYLSSGIGQFAVARRLVGVRPPLIFQGKLLLASLLALGLTGALPRMGQGWVSLLTQGAWYAGAVLLLLYVLKPVETGDIESARRVNPWLHRLAQWFGRVSPVGELAGRVAG